MSPNARVAPQVTMSLRFKTLPCSAAWRTPRDTGRTQRAWCAGGTLKEGPKPGEHVQLFRMEWDRNKGFYSEKR